MKRIFANQRLYIALCFMVALGLSAWLATKPVTANASDEEKTVTTVGVICVLENGNIIHITTTGENIDGRIKGTEETVDFIIEHQNEILDELIKAIVEAGQRDPAQNSKKENLLKIGKMIKKKV